MQTTSAPYRLSSPDVEMIFFCRDNGFLGHRFQPGTTPSQPHRLVYQQLAEDSAIEKRLSDKFPSEQVRPFMQNFFGGNYWPIEKAIKN